MKIINSILYLITAFLVSWACANVSEFMGASKHTSGIIFGGIFVSMIYNIVILKTYEYNLKSKKEVCYDSSKCQENCVCYDTSF